MFEEITVKLTLPGSPGDVGTMVIIPFPAVYRILAVVSKPIIRLGGRSEVYQQN